VHYHTGLVDDAPPPGLTEEALRRRLVEAQERVLYYAAEVWNAPSTLSANILDVGCGLGGGAIFWAHEFGARVTAVTIVPSHIDYVARFAAQAGVNSRVQALLCDAEELPGENRFDAAVAVDSSGYLDRRKWFRRVASLLCPGGYLFIIDCFVVRREYEEPFNHHWHTRIGSLAEYLSAAREAGLRPESIEDISQRTEHFWTTTLALIRTEAQTIELSSAEAIRNEASRRAHSLVLQGLQDEGLRYALSSFSKTR
jgi:cyclopropane fatty-acyl-phospholipid synthase-like methyltransferase